MGLAPSRVSHKQAVGRLLGLEREAHEVADRLPELLLDAQRIAATVAHGIHGRRRAGPGETFWQFRQLQTSDSAQLIDWRRSARSFSRSSWPTPMNMKKNMVIWVRWRYAVPTFVWTTA